MFSKEIFNCNRFTLLENEKGWVRILNKGCPGAAVAAIRPDGRILLVKELRVTDPLEPLVEVWNIPRGGRNAGETTQATACREFFEETDIQVQAHRFEHLARIRPDTGVVFGYVDLYRVKLSWEESIQFKVSPDNDEILEAKWVSLKEGYALMKAGQLEDSFSIIALGILSLEDSF